MVVGMNLHPCGLLSPALHVVCRHVTIQLVYVHTDKDEVLNRCCTTRSEAHIDPQNVGLQRSEVEEDDLSRRSERWYRDDAH
mmetsp:Transcript_11764/g.35873  ORF Transcript_11764/g.35873 Transcript_11764/m.35873 type:complete len:82 (-) Transcript_11764:1352-1597(-)